METDRGFLLVVAAVLLVVSALFVLPFLQYFLLAVVLAYLLTPVQRWLETFADERIAAGALVVSASVAIVIPLVVVTRTVAADAAALYRALRGGDSTITQMETAIRQATGVEVDLTAPLRALLADGGPGTVGNILDVFGAVTHLVVGLSLTVFLLYYFLKDGDRFVSWLRWVMPVPRPVQDDLFDAIDDMTWAVLAGHVFVATVQGLIAGVGLLATGVPNALFWTAVMIVLALLPVVGSFLVWGPAVAYLALTGRPLAALILAVYGTVVVGLSDNYLRPVVVDRYAHVNPSVVVIGVVGGLYVIGFMGLFVGPIVIGALRATLDVYREQYGAPGGA